ncbi:hypothetical protein HII31_04411 [Pseudocercospora fuligena]|uniref:DUF3176 domain-containing protein n=1 Tax=Pseudocercospora fuligena TaxID=685502 RepID=A0A8H6VN17_9PEZI|nr:hypothetical protein HII31_04411 [Pseudocercospora fuligena]
MEEPRQQEDESQQSLLSVRAECRGSSGSEAVKAISLQRLDEKAPSTASRRNRMLNGTKSWWGELLAMTISVCALVSIAGILFAYNGKPRSTWQAIIRPNTVVSALSTLSKSAMLMAIGQGIGQLKWVYFARRPHRLLDFEIFDAASRGPLGAVRILYSVNRRALVVSCGALITIIALAMDPFMQQVISYESKTDVQAGSKSSIPTSRAYDSNSPGGPAWTVDPKAWWFDPVSTANITAAVYAGIFARDPERTSAQCSSGDCQWGSFENLGICSNCMDVTSRIRIKEQFDGPFELEDSCTQGLGNPWRLYVTPAGAGIYRQCGRETTCIASGEMLWNTTIISDSSEEDGRSQDGTIMKFSTLKVPIHHAMINESEPCSAPVQQALDCRLSWCAKTYARTTVSNGTIYDLPTSHEALVFMDKTPPGVPGIPYNKSYSGPYHERWKVPPCNNVGSNATDRFCPLRLAAFKPSQLPDLSHLQPPYGLSNFTENANAFWLNYMDALTFQHGFGTILSASLENGSTGVDFRNPAQKFHQVDDFPALLDNVCQSLTKAIREGPNSTNFFGTVAVTEQYIFVHWQWMALSATLVLTSVLFLAASISFDFETSGAAWKSSTLPYLLHGLNAEAPSEVHARDLDEMESQAGKVWVVLSENEDTNLKLIRRKNCESNEKKSTSH